MMKLISFILSLLFCSAVFAQNVISNGNFEDWRVDSYFTPDEYGTEIPITRVLVDTPTVQRSSDSYDGNYSIRLETRTNQVDTFGGVFISGGDIFGEGGFPYTQMPDSLVGFYKCDIQTNDTAQLVAFFTDAGSFSGLVQFEFTGSQSSWTRFAGSVFYFPLTTPDTLRLAGLASAGEVAYPGTWIMFDSLHFKGTGITQQVPNGNFENWTEVSYDEPESWQTPNAFTSFIDEYSVSKTSDSYSGSSALRLETIEILDDTIGFITNGDIRIDDDTIVGGVPFTSSKDTLVGYYKYSPVGVDTAGVGFYFSKNGSLIDSAFVSLLSQSSYTKFELPFDLSQTPDTMLLVIVSSIDDQEVGSVLHIDSLILSSILTSLNKRSNMIKDFNVFPNPTSEILQLQFEKLNNAIEIEIIDAVGRVYNQELLSVGQMNKTINVQNLRRGTYYLRLRSGEDIIHRSFIKQ